MALVPYNPSAVVPRAQLQVAKHVRKPPTSTLTDTLDEIARVHAQYGVPYATKAGLLSLKGLTSAKNYKQGGPQPRAVAARVIMAPAKRKQKQSVSVSQAPAAIGTTSRGVAPQVGGAKRGAGGNVVRVKHTALFGSITGASAFTLTSYRVNPGIGDVFPWLSGIAGAFDMYRIVSMNFRYVPVTGTDTEGAMYFAWDPDPVDAAPTTKSQLMAFQVSATGPAWKPCSLSIPSQGVKYVRRGDVVGASLNTYDNGQLLVAVQSAAAQLLGDLYVDYVVELVLPHITASSALLYQPQFIQKSAGTVAKATPFGTLPPLSYGPICVDNNTFTYPSAGLVRMPVLNVTSYDNGSGARTYRLIVDYGVVGTGVAVVLTCSDSGATVTAQKAVAYSTTEQMATYSVTWSRPPVPGTYLTLDYSGCTTVTSTSLDITQVADGTSGTWMS